MVSIFPDDAMNPLSATSLQQSRPALRRATYVHVSDLTSAYNIDHAKLEQEIARVNAERESTIEDIKEILPETDVDPSDTTAELDATATTSPQKRLQPPRGGFNLCVLVGKLTLVVDKRRVDQSRVRLAEVEIGDETGTVSLRARDEQIDVLEEVSRRSGAVVLRNCTLELYQGKHIRLAVTKWGKLSTYPDNVPSTPPPPSKMNQDRNFSLIDLSVVASEMVDPQPEITYINRQTKGLETTESSNRTFSSKSTSQAHSKQSQSSSRRNSRGRQTKSKQGPSSGHTQPQYINPGGGDIGAIASQPGPMAYHGMHPYPVYDQGLDLRQYPYTHHARSADSVMQNSTQQYMMQRQYELQQRQLHHLYHGQQEHPRSVVSPSHHPAQPPGVLLQPVLASGSFDTHEYGQVPSYPSSTSSPILIPLTRSGAPATMPAPAVAHRGETHESITGSGQEKDTQAQQCMSVSPDDSQFSHGRMNPEATAFAPSYMSPQANPSSSHHQLYFPFDPSQSPAGNPYVAQPHQTALYQGGLLYMPASARAPSDSLSGKTQPTSSSEAVQKNTANEKSSSKEATGYENLPR